MTDYIARHTIKTGMGWTAVLLASVFLFSMASLAGSNLDRKLVEAVEKGDSKLVTELLEAGADPNALVESGGVTPLMFAAEAGDVMIINMLLNAGADPSAVDGKGAPVMAYAAKSGRKYAVDALIVAGAPYAVNDKNGNSMADLARNAGYGHVAKDIDDRVDNTNKEIGELRIDMQDGARAEDYESAADTAREVYERSLAAYGEKDERTLSALNDLALMSFRAERYEEAGLYYKELLKYSREVYGPTSEMTAIAANNLGVYHYSLTDRSTAARYFAEAYEISSKRLGEEHDMTGEFHANLLMAQGEINEPPAPLESPGTEGEGASVGDMLSALSEGGSGPRFRGGGASGSSGVFDMMGLKGEDGKKRMTGILSWLAVFFAVLGLIYVTYRIIGSLSDSSDEARAMARFEARMSLSLGRLSEKFEKPEAAARHYEIGLKVLKRDFQSRYRLAKIYHHKLFNISRAKLHYRELVMSLPPDHPFRVEAIEAIKSMNTVRDSSPSLF